MIIESFVSCKAVLARVACYHLPCFICLLVVLHGEVHVLLLLPSLLCKFVSSCLNNSFDDKKIPDSQHMEKSFCRH